MHALAALVAAGLLGAVAIPGGSGDARVDAASAILDVPTGVYRLEGGVVIARGLVRLRAKAARYDPRTGEVEATGGVLLTDATRAIAAEGIHAVIDGDFEAREVVAYLKAGVTDLTLVTSPAEAGACGRNAMTARAVQVTGRPGGELTLEGARVTPCDCAEGPPSWELRATSALVHPGDRVELTWPVLWITPRFILVERPVPIFILPWISLPLGDRVSGLLATQIGSTGTTGWAVSQPLYLTLGQSADVTVTPHYAFGRKRSEVEAGKPSVRGPGVGLEGRWTPVVGAAGRLVLDVTWDLDDDVGDLAGADGAEGLRVALSGGWAQRLSERTALQLELNLVGDPLYVRDFTTDLLLRGANVRRSAALASHRRADAVVEGWAAWLEPVSSSGALSKDVDYGLLGGKLPSFHAGPSVGATLLPIPLGGPLTLTGRVGLSRFAPVNGDTSDGGADGVGPGDPGWVRITADPAELDGQWQPGERLAATRLAARAELSAPFTIGDVLGLTPWLRGAGAGYAFDSSRDPVANGWGSAGLTASTALARRFGGLRHVVEPRVEWLATSGVAGDPLPAFGYDAWDRAGAAPPGVATGTGLAFTGYRLAASAPPGLSNQLRLAVGTRLVRGDAELFRAEVGQEVDLDRGGLAEGWVQARGARGLFSGQADVRFWTGGRLIPARQPTFDSWLDAFSEIQASLAVSDGRGDQLHAGLLAVGQGGAGRLGAGADDLFDARPTPVDALASGSLGALLRLGPATVGYDVTLPVRTAYVPACIGTGSRIASPWEVQQQTGTVEWDSPCRCFKARLELRRNACGDLGGGITLDLGRAAGLAR